MDATNLGLAPVTPSDDALQAECYVIHCSRSLALLRIRGLDGTDVQLWQAQLRNGKKNRLCFANPTCIPSRLMTFRMSEHA